MTKLMSLDEMAALTGALKESGKGGHPPKLSHEIERCATPADVLAYAEKRGLRIVDFKFTDLLGRWHHFSLPIHHLTEDLFDEGLGFDGSSVRAFQAIHESDMVLFPIIESAIVDPAMEIPTLSLLCSIHEPISKRNYNRDPRNVAMKAEQYLVDSGIADASYWGPEAEFFIFDGIRFGDEMGRSFFEIESNMAAWESGRKHDHRFGSNLGYRPDRKRGYFRVPPVDSFQDWRSEAILRMVAAGIDVEGPLARPVLDPETMESTTPGVFVAGTAVAGSQRSHRVFIENSHPHVARIVRAITGREPPFTTDDTSLAARDLPES